MFRTEVIDQINDGEMWALVGSGTSMDSGGPSWRSLATGVQERVRSEGLLTTEDSRLSKYMERSDYLKAFSRLVEIAGRSKVEEFIRDLTVRIQPGKIACAIADWPFAGYVTTNYDSAIELALNDLHVPGWVPVGNTGSELSKISGGAKNVVWHIHGASALPDRSNLILTQEDYDSLYNNPSEVFESISALLTNHRLVVVGFGFADPEVTRLIRKVGRKTPPERPIYAFLGDSDGTSNQDDRNDLREYSNVDVIPYSIRKGDHSELRQMIDVYSSFIITRNFKLNQPRRPTPAWDAETTALLTYNELVLKHSANLSDDILERLLKSRIIARLKFEGKLGREDIIRELSERARLLSADDRNLGVDLSRSGEVLVDSTVESLVSVGLVSATDGRLALTQEGEELVSKQRSIAELLREQFFDSIKTRVANVEERSESIQKITEVLSEFLEECMTQRGLGVALAWNGSTTETRKIHFKALLQHFPTFISQLSDTSETEAAICSLRDLLASPNDTEQIYLGMRMQAEFSVQMLAFSPELVAARAQQMKETVFLIDSSVLIPFFAEGNAGCTSSKLLIEELKSLNSVVATTDDLVQELRDHAWWARQFINKSGPFGVDVISAATGRSGQRSNVFIEGFLAQVGDSGLAPDFDRYIDQLFLSSLAHQGALVAFKEACESHGILVKAFPEWKGFDPQHWSQRDDSQVVIEKLRRQRESYRSELQVKAEAGVRVIVELLRSKTFGIAGRDVSSAYFVSNSRVVDYEMPRGERITIRADSMLQWLGTLSGTSLSQLSCLVDSLLYELATDGFEVVDKDRLMRVFSPTVDASLSRMKENQEQYRILSASKYGEDPNLAFADPLDAPLVEQSVLLQKAISAEEERDIERLAKLAAQDIAKMSENDRAELEKLRQRQNERRRKSIKSKRAAKSRAGRRRKKRK